MRAPTHLPRLLNAVRKGSGFAQARGRDPDFEQAILRVVMASVVFAYAGFIAASGPGLTFGLLVALVCAAGNASVGAWMAWWFRTHDHRPAAMRYLGLCSDLVSVTLGMAGTDEAGVPLIGVYLWVTVGNGFRFGPRYLLVSYWISLAGFLLLMIFVPFWQTHRPIGVGFTMILAGVPLYVLVLLSRLTAQKNEAEQLSNAKSRFVANVSHELRTPLTGVFAVHELLRLRKMTPDDRELVGMLGNAIATLKQSVDAVLQMSKLEAGAERTEPRPFNLWYFLQQLDVLHRPSAAAKGLAWSIQVETDVACAVVGDPSHLSHALGNLINNAFKFTASGGVTVVVRNCGPDRIRLEVVDTGIGIPLEHQERLFERFVQVDTSATRRYGGTGLGTSIAHDLVGLMGGDIGVVSAQGHGSRFWIELPLPALSAESAPAGARLPRDVRVVEAAGSHGALTGALTGLGIDATVRGSEDRRAGAADAPHGVTLLAMSAAEAAAYAGAVLARGTAGHGPWLVVAPSYTPTQYAALQRMGAAGLFTDGIAPRELAAQLAAVEGTVQGIEPNGADAARRLRSTRPRTILLADDNPSNRLLFTKILEDAGHTVRPADRGDQAFDLMASGGIDFAILDLNMPDISGPDVVKLYRASSIGADRLPIIILSADATPDARAESIGAGANEFLTKPVTAPALLAAIERVVAGVADRDAPPSTRDLPAAGRDDAHAEPSAGTDVPALQGQLIDPDRIQSLYGIARGQRGFLEQYVSAALVELDDAITKVRAAAERGNAREARDALHIIIGTGASIGADALVQSARALGTHFAGGAGVPPPAAFADLSATYALTKPAVSAMLLEPSGASAARGASR